MHIILKKLGMEYYSFIFTSWNQKNLFQNINIVLFSVNLSRSQCLLKKTSVSLLIQKCITIIKDSYLEIDNF